MSKLKLILSFLNKREKRLLVFVFFCMVAVGLLQVIGVGSISPFMSVVSDPEVIKTNHYLNWVYHALKFESTKSFIISLGIAVVVFMAVSNLSRAGMSFVIKYYSGHRLHSISMRLLEKYLYQPYVFFLNINSSDLSKNILSEVATFVNGVLVILLELMTNIVISLSIIILLVIINPMVALVVSVILGLAYFLIFSAVRSFLNKKGKERAIVNSLKYKYISEAFGGIKDVKLLGRESIFLEMFSRPSIKYAMNNAVSDVVGDVPKYILETIAFAGIIGIILFRFKSGDDVKNYLPTLTLYTLGGYRLLPALQKIFKSITKIKYNLPIVEILYNDYTRLFNHEKRNDYKASSPLCFKREIRLKNLSFRYPNTQETVIKNQNLEIRANTSVGFVGPTGCGKTTIIDIVLGLLKAQEGSLLVDDVEIDDSNRRKWQANLGYVPQTIYLIDDTIKRNIAFGVPDDEIDIKAVKRAAAIANLDDFIENELEEGFNSMVGERGIRLSGGQRQRIGIARAVYHNPSVLIMDEATSALDGLTENAIMDAINNLSHKKTIIMIAHRLTTVKACDEIFIMEKGEIIDRGTYDDLLIRNESFRIMAEGSK